MAYFGSSLLQKLPVTHVNADTSSSHLSSLFLPLLRGLLTSLHSHNKVHFGSDFSISHLFSNVLLGPQLYLPYFLIFDLKILHDYLKSFPSPDQNLL
jgi:hypothetical protein